MDPNEALAQLIEWAKKVDGNDELEGAEALEEAESAACRIMDLHEWLSKGGFLPDAWQPHLLRESRKGDLS